MTKVWTERHFRPVVRRLYFNIFFRKNVQVYSIWVPQGIKSVLCPCPGDRICSHNLLIVSGPKIPMPTRQHVVHFSPYFPTQVRTLTSAKTPPVGWMLPYIQAGSSDSTNHKVPSHTPYDHWNFKCSRYVLKRWSQNLVCLSLGHLSLTLEGAKMGEKNQRRRRGAQKWSLPQVSLQPTEPKPEQTLLPRPPADNAINQTPWEKKSPDFPDGNCGQINSLREGLKNIARGTTDPLTWGISPAKNSATCIGSKNWPPDGATWDFVPTGLNPRP